MKHILILLITASLSSCIKDREYRTYTLRRAEHSIKPEIKEAARLQAPRELKDPGSFALKNTTMYVNEKDKGIHVIDVSVPSNPVNKGFIPLPGNRGIAVKEDILYADCYMDLFVFRIGADHAVTLETSLANVFPGRANTDDTMAIKTTWTSKDTTVLNSASGQEHTYLASSFDAGIPQKASQNQGGNSVGSSLAIFTISKDHLYTVSNNNLSAFSLADKKNPVFKNTQWVGFDIETIFPFKDNLFLGSMTGMFIFSISDPANPSRRGMFSHARVCDPVIADDNFAFVTLRSGNTCGGSSNQMDVLNIGNIESPLLMRSYPLSNPHGLSKDGNILFICDGAAGLKMFDATDVMNIVLKQNSQVGRAIDVVAVNNMAYVMFDNAIRIYLYDNQFNLHLQSTINTH